MGSASRTPIVFFGHGSPTTILDDSRTMDAWRGIAHTIGKPKAILCVSAHWCTDGVEVTAMGAPQTIHDFGRGLPSELFDVQYSAPGSPKLADRVREILEPVAVKLDYHWGYDHACWTVLSVAYPDADVPVIQLSMDASKPISWHYEIGRALMPLRDEGIAFLRKLQAADVSAVGRVILGTSHAADVSMPDVVPDIYQDSARSLFGFAKSL